MKQTTTSKPQVVIEDDEFDIAVRPEPPKAPEAPVVPESPEVPESPAVSFFKDF